MTNEQVVDLVSQRTAARARKDWQDADRIRELLNEEGFVLEDGIRSIGYVPAVSMSSKMRTETGARLC